MKNRTTPKYKKQIIEESINKSQKIEQTVDKIINRLGIRDYLDSNWSNIYKKIIHEYNNLQGDNENKFTSLIEKMKIDINDIVLNCSVISPFTLKAVIDRIMKSNKSNNLNDIDDISKASISIFMSILLYVLFRAVKDKNIKNERKESITELTNLINKCSPIPFSELTFNS